MCGKCSILQLFNENGRELNSQEIVGNARVYTLKRRRRLSSERERALFRATNLTSLYRTL